MTAPRPGRCEYFEQRGRELERQLAAERQRADVAEHQCELFVGYAQAKEREQRNRAERLEAALREIRAAVDSQAADEGLWYRAERISEAYLQQELRKLHAVVEGVDPTGPAVCHECGCNGGAHDLRCKPPVSRECPDCDDSDNCPTGCPALHAGLPEVKP